MKDRRRHQRFTVSVMDMKCKMVFGNDVRIIDISIGGVSFKTDRKLDLDGEYTLRMEGKGKVLCLKGIVAWSSLIKGIETPGSESVPVYKTGMKFSDVSKEKMKEILAFIESHKKELRQEDMCKLSGFRMHVRFLIETPEKAVLNIYEGYEIKNLSLSGMLIESKDPLEIGRKIPMEIVRSADKSIKFLGRVVSCTLSKDNDREFYDIRIEFLDMPEKDREMLKEVICMAETLGFIAL